MKYLYGWKFIFSSEGKKNEPTFNSTCKPIDALLSPKLNPLEGPTM